MNIFDKVQDRLTGFKVEAVDLKNSGKYENIFLSNTDYYMITDGRPATYKDCLETIEYAKDFPIGYSIGFKKGSDVIAFLSFFECYPEENVCYIGLFLVDKRFRKHSYGTQIINALIDVVFSSGYTSVKLSVQDNNVSGYSFWRKMGFECVDTTQCNGFNNISMELKKTYTIDT